MARGVDDPVIEELVGDVGRLIDEATRIGAQIEDDPGERTAGAGAQRRGGLEQLVVRALLELLHAHVADAIQEELRRDAGHVDDLAHQIEGEDLGDPGASHTET